MSESTIEKIFYNQHTDLKKYIISSDFRVDILYDKIRNICNLCLQIDNDEINLDDLGGLLFNKKIKE